MKHNRVERRIVKEIGQLKEKYPTVIVSDDNRELQFTFLDIKFTLSLPDGYPFKAPYVKMNKYNISDGKRVDHSPQDLLVDYIPIILSDIQTAEANEAFQNGSHCVGHRFVLEKIKTF